MVTLILVALGVVFASAICSGTEAALFLVSMVRVRQLAETGKASAKALLKIRERMNRPIAAIVILNNVANISGSGAVGVVAASALGSTKVGIVTGCLTFAVIIFSEIIPKTLGERFAEPIALLVARPVLAVTWVLTPIIWVIERLTSPLTKGGATATTNESEIRLLARIGQEEGAIESNESKLIQHVFDLNDRTAGEIMTPRLAVTWLKHQSTLAEAKDAIIQSQHSRIIIANDTLDKVSGAAYKEELLAALLNGKHEQELGNFVHQVHITTKEESADNLLHLFQKSRRHLAMVLDEFGTVSGVVTLEDVLEVLTGEIVDETDRNVDLQEEARKRRAKLSQ